MLDSIALIALLACFDCSPNSACTWGSYLLSSKLPGSSAPAGRRRTVAAPGFLWVPMGGAPPALGAFRRKCPRGALPPRSGAGGPSSSQPAWVPMVFALGSYGFRSGFLWFSLWVLMFSLWFPMVSAPAARRRTVFALGSYGSALGSYGFRSGFRWSIQSDNSPNSACTEGFLLMI